MQDALCFNLAFLANGTVVFVDFSTSKQLLDTLKFLTPSNSVLSCLRLLDAIAAQSEI
jgi:hypothetical protein